MKLLSVTLSGIFAYEEEVKIDLSKTTVGQNLVLIWGRNGKGKTSFINAMKLLFSGVTHERSRRVGFPPQILPAGQFVLGDGDHWMGVINRRVRRKALTQNQPAVASVEATCEIDGKPITARREFATTETGSFVEHVFLTEGGVRISGKAAADRLGDFLPPDYVGFFFFDGEDIKSLAETAERKSIDFDQLLRLTFAGELEKELKEAALERGRRNLKKEDREELRRVKVSLSEAQELAKEARELLSGYEEDLLLKRSQLARAETVRDNLATGASEAQRKELEQSQARLEKAIQRSLAQIVTGRLPVTAPLLANLPLAEQAISMFERRLAGDGAAEQRVTRRIAAALPSWVEEIEVPLDAGQRKAVTEALVNRLQEPRATVDEGLFAPLDIDRAERIRDTMVRFAAGGWDVRQAQAALLLSVHRDTEELADTEERLMRLRVGSEANLERFREVERQIKELNEKIGEIQQSKGAQAHRLENADRDVARFTLRRDELDALAKRAVKDERESRFIDRVVEALAETRERARRQARDEVQVLLNQRFKELVHDHDLIAEIQIDDSYTLNFFDNAGRPIGRASLSSGLKQLAATALQWSMMEASGHRMPVIIDTPLGRIDKENQDNMLTRYYPRLSEQVIILPTNAEIDARKMKAIAGRVAEQYVIENPTGDSAAILPGTLEAAAHG